MTLCVSHKEDLPTVALPRPSFSPPVARSSCSRFFSGLELPPGWTGQPACSFHGFVPLRSLTNSPAGPAYADFRTLRSIRGTPSPKSRTGTPVAFRSTYPLFFRPKAQESESLCSAWAIACPTMRQPAAPRFPEEVYPGEAAHIRRNESATSLGFLTSKNAGGRSGPKPHRPPGARRCSSDSRRPPLLQEPCQRSTTRKRQFLLGAPRHHFPEVIHRARQNPASLLYRVSSGYVRPFILSAMQASADEQVVSDHSPSGTAPASGGRKSAPARPYCRIFV